MSCDLLRPMMVLRFLLVHFLAHFLALCCCLLLFSFAIPEASLNSLGLSYVEMGLVFVLFGATSAGLTLFLVWLSLRDKGRASGTASISDSLSQVPSWLNIMRKQLAGAREDTEAGVIAIIEQLHQIHSSSRELSSNVPPSFQSSTSLSNAHDDQLEHNRRLFEVINRQFSRRDEMLRNQAKGFGGLLENLDRAGSAVSKIVEVVKFTKLAVGNSVIEATLNNRTLPQMDSLADEARKSLAEIGNIAVQVVADVESIERSLRSELAGITVAMAERDTVEELQRVAHEVHAVELQAIENSQVLAKLLDAIGSNSTVLVEKLTAAQGLIQFQDIVRQRVEHVEEGLLELADYFEGLGKTDARGMNGQKQEHDSTLKERLKQHCERYVMAKERIVHATESGTQEPGDDRPLIEIFT
jgi:methyl-accepting chemotaxis protein